VARSPANSMLYHQLYNVIQRASDMLKPEIMSDCRLVVMY
jgi:hypothetical protein